MVPLTPLATPLMKILMMSKYWNEIQNSSLEKREEEGGITATVRSNSKKENKGLLDLENCSEDTHTFIVMKACVLSWTANLYPSLPMLLRKIEEHIAVAVKGGGSTIRSFGRRDNLRRDRQEEPVVWGNFARSKFIPLYLLAPSLPLPLNVCNNFRFRWYRIWRVNFSRRSLPLADLQIYSVLLDRLWIGIAC